ncbi:MAG: NAD(P)H-dependent flavin oxidoreductase [Bacillus sp. (in: firmicutes)]
MKRVCDLLSIKVPFVQGGMGNISNAPLASAVSEAGGLGMIGCGTMTPKEVESIIIETTALTDKPFALNIPINVCPSPDAMLEMAITYNIPVVSLSAGNPAPYIPFLKEKGVKVMVVVAAVSQAKKAEAAGADLLIAEGFEAAGINSSLETTTFSLIPQITEAVSIPVLAAGGIGDGRGVAAALLLGAGGVQMGTRLIATKDAPVHLSYKQKILDADDKGTVIIGRSVGRTRRVLRTPYADRLASIEKEQLSAEAFHEWTSESRHITGALEGDFENGFINAGQIAGLIEDLPTVKQLFETMMKEAVEKIDSIGEGLKQLKS